MKPVVIIHNNIHAEMQVFWPRRNITKIYKQTLVI